MLRVLMLSKALVVGAYQRKLEELAALGLHLTVAVPPGWRDERGFTPLERAYTRGYHLRVEPVRFNGRFHLHYYPHFGRLLAQVRPDLVHLDEEPYNLATWHAQRAARRQGARTLFFSWQNLLRQYPWPFSYFERDVLRHAQAGIAGNQAAVEVWRAKGFRGPLRLIPQFGVDPDLFHPEPAPPGSVSTFVVGYAGRLVAEKGVDSLLRALARLPAEGQTAVSARLAGTGPERGRLQRLAEALGLAGRVSFESQWTSTQMPRFYHQLDCLVLPSRTRPNWKEQFGRVLVEAMACGVPVVGSTCGEIPNVIGPAGLVFPEGDVAALAAHLHTLQQQPDLRASLAAAGRARVLQRFTQRQIAADTAAFYRELCDAPPRRG